MMIGPGGYVAENIEGKTREEALGEIENLWEEIRRLRALIEDEVQSDEMMYHPAPGVKISVYHDYIEAARAYFEDQGWEYEPSKEEIKDREFNDKLDQVEIIEVEYGGFFGGGVSLTITFDGEDIKAKRIARPYSVNLDMTEKEEFEVMTRTEFLNELKDLHIGEWASNYDNPNVLDGTSWSVVFKYVEGKKQEFGGINKYPYNFDRFLDVMEIESRED